MLPPLLLITSQSQPTNTFAAVLLPYAAAACSLSVTYHHRPWRHARGGRPRAEVSEIDAVSADTGVETEAFRRSTLPYHQSSIQFMLLLLLLLPFWCAAACSLPIAPHFRPWRHPCGGRLRAECVDTEINPCQPTLALRWRHSATIRQDAAYHQFSV